jgi:hypothetical protein
LTTLRPSQSTSIKRLPFTIVAIPIAHELVFIAMRSGMGIACEVNSSGGSFGVKRASRKPAYIPDQVHRGERRPAARSINTVTVSLETLARVSSLLLKPP